MEECNLCKKEIQTGTDGIKYCPNSNCDNYTQYDNNKPT